MFRKNPVWFLACGVAAAWFNAINALDGEQSFIAGQSALI